MWVIRVYWKVKRFLQHSFSSTPASKLSPKYFGPFTVLAKVGKVAYKLQLPEGKSTYPAFHVSLLKKTIEPMTTTCFQLPPVDEDKEVTVEPQAIADRRITYKDTIRLTEVLV